MKVIATLLLPLTVCCFCIASDGDNSESEHSDEQPEQALTVNEHNYHWFGLSDYVADICYNTEDTCENDNLSGVSKDNRVYCFKKWGQEHFLIECEINNSDVGLGGSKRNLIMRPEYLVQITLRSKDEPTEPRHYIAEHELCRLMYLSAKLLQKGEKENRFPSSNLFFCLRPEKEQPERHRLNQ